MNQSVALDILKTGGNVFLTGEPGTGKTHVVNQYIAWLETAGVNVAVTASTGVAATHIGGMTIHSWCRLGPRDSLTEHDVEQIVANEKTNKRINKANVLIIDEVSMLGGNVLDMVDTVCRKVRNKPESFGGLQVVLVGDFFQLPPITRYNEPVQYAFKSRAWADARFLVCYLSDQFRQEDEMLLGLLRSIRKNDVDDEHFTLLSEQTEIAYPDIEPTRLYTHNMDVDTVNSSRLSELSAPTRKFQMVGHGNKLMQQGLVKNCLSPECLELKEEAMVMCTKNNFEAGYVNGTLARVVSFDAIDGLPIIETTEGREIKIEPTSWEVIEEKKTLASVEQLPLRLAWAITVHKSQGMSLDAAEIDLSKAFAFGQGYVALSRVRTLAGLKMLGMSPTALRVDPEVVAKDERMQVDSDLVEETFSQMESEELESMQRNFLRSSGGEWPTGEIKVRTKGYERVQKESTLEKTKELLKEKKSIREIAKERNIKESTAWSHLEKLVEERAIGIGDLTHLQNKNHSENEPKVLEAIEELGDEKLKPLFEYCDEKIDYETVRLVRMLHRLQDK
ncbi:AAA family ATPase [bacterium]|nr:AAA family ATPase [bacterium]